MSDKVYQITKQQCEENHKGLVCSGCGNPISAIETVDNANNPTYWSGCDRCNRFQCGVPFAIWEAVQRCFEKDTYLSDNELIKRRRDYCDTFMHVNYYYRASQALQGKEGSE